MTRPLVFLDVETTGKYVDRGDRIVSLAILRIEDGKPHNELYFVIDPERSVPPEATAIHGLREADFCRRPNFKLIAPALAQELAGTDICGHNVIFDLRFLECEFQRAGIDWQPTGRIIDTLSMWRHLEPRNLEAAVERFCGRKAVGSHNALQDTKNTMDVFLMMRANYPLLNSMTLDDIAALDNRVDLAGKLSMDDQGRVCFNFGKHRDEPVLSQRGYAAWCLKQNFPPSTQRELRRLLEPRGPGCVTGEPLGWQASTEGAG